MVELVKQLAVPPGRALEQSLCEKHDEKQKLFCKEDEDLMCVICRESREHRTHTALPIDEAAHEYKGKLQAWLQSLKEELGDLLESKLKEEEGYKAMMKKLITDKLKMVAEFDGLRQLLKDQEETLLMRLEKMERSIKMAENANEGKYSSKISFISDLIAETEKKCEQPPLELLKDIRRTLSRCGNATLHLSEGLKKKYKALVTLDPDTAYRYLTVTEDGRRVTRTSKMLSLPENPKRFTLRACVLGRTGFNSGRHYWELHLLKDGPWCVGVAQECVSRNGSLSESPERGVWALERNNGQYEALTSPRFPLSPQQCPVRLGLYLDYEGRRLSFYNADTMERFYTFTNAAFNTRVYPYFWVGLPTNLRLV